MNNIRFASPEHRDFFLGQYRTEKSAIYRQV